MDVNKTLMTTDFYQQVRRLLRHGYTLEDNIRFISPLSLQSVSRGQCEVNKVSEARLEIEVSSEGLTGALGALPTAYTEWLIERFYRYGDKSAKDFLDIFSHRLHQLRYQSWLHSHYYARAEFESVIPLSREIAALSGTLHQLPVLRSQRNAFLSAGPVRSMTGLEQWLGLFLGVGVAITPFRGSWRQADVALRARAGLHSLTLGMAPMLGQAYHDIQSGFTLAIGPVTQADVERFLPDGPLFRAIRARIEGWLGQGLDMVVDLLIDSTTSVPTPLGEAKLGFDTCLGREVAATRGWRNLRIADSFMEEDLCKHIS